MGRTHAKKIAARESRLRALPQAERLAKSALIKKKEGRILDAAEKHALRMSSDHGTILMLWEQLRKAPSASSASRSDESGPHDPHTRTAEAAPQSKQEDGHVQTSPSRTLSEEKRKAFEHKYPIVQKLIKLIEPKAVSSLRTPSISRVVQSMIKYGSPDHLARIFQWLSTEFDTYATDAYAHFVVTALIRHSTHEMFKSMLRCLLPAVHRLVTNKYGIEVIHAAYSSHWCSAMERDLVILTVFKDNISVMKTWAGYPNISAVLECNAAMRKRLLTRLFELCDKLVSQKDAIAYPFVQKLTLAYLHHGSRDEVTELCDTLRPHVVSVAGGADGALLCSLVFTLSEPKSRKDILVHLRPALGELCMGKYSAPIIAHIFDYMYDVQLLNKYIVNDLVAHLPAVLESPHGYRILVHLLTPHQNRKQRFLLPHWFAHNLYSMENDSWNHHSWLNASYETEVVEVCSRSALTSHLAVLPTLAEAFVQYMRTVHEARGECEGEEKNALLNATEEKAAPTRTSKVSRAQREHCAIIAREMVHVAETETTFRTSLKLSPSAMDVLRRGSAAQGNTRTREGDDAHGDEEIGSAPVRDENDGAKTTTKTTTTRKTVVKKTKKTKAIAADDGCSVRARSNSGKGSVVALSDGEALQRTKAAVTESKRSAQTQKKSKAKSQKSTT